MSGYHPCPAMRILHMPVGKPATTWKSAGARLPLWRDTDDLSIFLGAHGHVRALFVCDVKARLESPGTGRISAQSRFAGLFLSGRLAVVVGDC
jgi:hypothetical protein